MLKMTFLFIMALNNINVNIVIIKILKDKNFIKTAEY